MTQKKDLPTFPVDERGNMLPYVMNRFRAEITEEDNTPRTMTLTFTGVSRGRSSVRFEFTGDGRTWSMFLSDVAILMKRFDFAKGVISGTWYVVKRGGDFGLAPHPSMLEES